MDILNKTIKKLSEEQYQELLMLVSGKKKNKPFVVLETTRNKDVGDSEMMELLQVNASTYYTLKSRLNSKIASLLSKNVDNPISELIDEVTKVPANLYGTNKEFSIRALKELEKQLIEYDLSSELIVVYKTLSQLHLYTDDFTHYDNLYKKHVAFSLAVTKVEGLFYQFIKLAGKYKLTRDQNDFEALSKIKREVSNICELYYSHRMFATYNIIRIYYLFISEESIISLKEKELEIENTLEELNRIFEKYDLDTFYQNIKFITDFLHFEYYQTTGNQVRADHYFENGLALLPDLCTKHMMSFHVLEFLDKRILKYLQDKDLSKLTDIDNTTSELLDIDKSEASNYITHKKFQATCKFYQRDYSGAARTINELRNDISLKQFMYSDIDCKLFQALNYCILGEDGLCMQILSSLKRQIKDHDQSYKSTKLFIKLLKSALKPADYRRKIKRINDLWDEFKELNTGKYAVLKNVDLDEITIRKMTNPIKD
jgi:hypothetical protein